MSRPYKTAVLRADPALFIDIAFAQAHPASYLEWTDVALAAPVRLAVIDEMPAGAPEGTFLLLHGEPSWSALYERWIPRLVDAGYRCVAVDLPGFGRSDKPLDDNWYTYERHCAAVRHVVASLDLRDVRLVAQDWAGPIGLRQAVDLPEPFTRLFVFNTWLHHAGYSYSEGIGWWRGAATDPAQLGGDMPTGGIVAGAMRRATHDLAVVQRLFDAPFPDAASKAGARAFPTMLPFAQPDRGGASQQERCHHSLVAWTTCPIHLAFGDGDIVFTYEHGREWADHIPGATIDRIIDAGHFVQYDAPDDCLAVIAKYEQRSI